MFARSVKRVSRAAFGLFGLELIRKPPRFDPPPLYDDPLEAVYEATQSNRPFAAAIRCPVDKIVDYQGFGFAADRWHPFVAVLRDLALHGAAQAEALLERYYAVFQPRNAAEAIPDFAQPPLLFRTLPPYLFRLTPWETVTPEEMDEECRRGAWVDNAGNGSPKLTLEKDGHQMFGPVSTAKRQLEMRRLSSIHASISSKGYDRRHGDCAFRVIRRGDDIRYLPCGGGYHRTAAIAACGHDWVPGRFYRRSALVIDTREVDLWPQVRRGVWTRDQALAYVDHLFDHSSAVWAQRHVNALGLKDFASPHGAKHEIHPRSRASSHRRDPVDPTHSPRGLGG
jgi:hypothetical protein